MEPLTNLNASIVSGPIDMPYNWIKYLFIEKPFSGALFLCESDEAILKSDVIHGNFDELSTKNKLYHILLPLYCKIGKLYLKLFLMAYIFVMWDSI